MNSYLTSIYHFQDSDLKRVVANLNVDPPRLLNTAEQPKHATVINEPIYNYDSIMSQCTQCKF